MSEQSNREKIKRGERQHAGVRRQARQLLAIAIVAVMVMGSLLVKVEAAPGNLDTTFSLDGKQTTTFGTNLDFGEAVAIQEDGKIVVAGGTINDDGEDFAVARYNINGTLDTTFSDDGKQTTDFAGKSDFAKAVAIQDDGKIVVAGVARVGGPDTGNFALARYNVNGTLDTTFSGNGKQNTDFGAHDRVNAIAIQSNGKIVAAGYTTSGSGNFALARYNTNGALDTTFSTDGKQTTHFSQTDKAEAVAIQDDDKIVVAGYTYNSSGTEGDFAVARYTPKGALDTTFSDDGRQTTNFFGYLDEAHAIAIQSDGRIVVAGYAKIGNVHDNDFALARYNVNGSLDNGFPGDSTPGDEFGVNGKVNTDFFASIDDARAVAIQSNGKIVAAGTAYHANITNPDFGLARYDSSGTLDTTFHGDGKKTTGFFSDSGDVGGDMAIQTDGKIVVAGTTHRSDGNVDFAVARYHDD